MKPWLLAAAVNGFLAVLAGAFAAHGLSDRLSTEALGWFETGARYHAYHTFALLAVAWLAGLPNAGGHGSCRLAGIAFVAGIVLFSGSLYLLALTGVRALGLVTPLGGLCFLAGWAFLGATALAHR